MIYGCCESKAAYLQLGSRMSLSGIHVVLAAAKQLLAATGDAVAVPGLHLAL